MPTTKVHQGLRILLRSAKILMLIFKGLDGSLKDNHQGNTAF